jgi:succinoglycan biosynthesis transport protein ExoP
MAVISQGEPATSDAPARLAQVLRRQWWVVVACVAVAALGALGYAKTRPTTYLATRSVTLPQATIPVANSSSSSSGPSVFGPPPASILADASVQRAVSRAAGAGATLSGAISPAGTSFVLTVQAADPPAAVRAVNAAAEAFVSAEQAALQADADQWNNVVQKYTQLRNQLQAQASQPGLAGADARAKEAVNATSLSQAYGFYNDYVGAIGTVLAGPAATAISGTSHTSAKTALELALAIGLVVGVAVALAREQLTVRVRAEEDITDLGMPVLSQIPLVRDPPSPIDVAADSHSALSESIREVRTKLRFLRADRPVDVLLVTSAEAGEGKSFVAANLAAAWAAAGSRTVLVSSDVRRPTIEAYFGGLSDPGGGLSEALLRGNAAIRRRHARVGDAEFLEHRRSLVPAGEAEVGSAVGNGNGRDGGRLRRAGPLPEWAGELLVPTGIDLLEVICAGDEPPTPTEMLGSAGMAELLTALRGYADLVVLDSPPVLAVTDALVLTEHADATLMVFARHRSNRRSLERALGLLAKGEAPVIGAVLNRSAEVHIEPSHYYDYRGPDPRAAGRHAAPGGSKAPDPAGTAVRTQP